jgi:hypothetical protein
MGVIKIRMGAFKLYALTLSRMVGFFTSKE